MNSDSLILDILEEYGYLRRPYSPIKNRIIKTVLTNYFKCNSTYRGIYHIDLYGCYTLICMKHCLDRLTDLYFEFLARITHFPFIENSVYLLEYYDVEEYNTIPILAERRYKFDKNFYIIFDDLKHYYTKIVIFQILGIIYIEDFFITLRFDWNSMFSLSLYILEFIENPSKVIKFLSIIVKDECELTLRDFIRRVFSRKGLKFNCKDNRTIFIPYEKNVFVNYEYEK